MLKNPEKEDLQDKLFPIPYDWEEEWRDMPEYHNWQEADPKITATFTPTGVGAAAIEIGAYNTGSNEAVYFDDLEVTQA